MRNIPRSSLLAALTGLLLATPAQADVVVQDAGGFTTRDTVAVEVDTQTAWLALIDPGSWWSDSHTWSGDAANMSIEPQAGGCFCERIPATEDDGAVGLEGSARHMVVVQSFPRRVLRMRGGLGPLQSEPADGVLTITLKPVERATQIVFEYVVGGAMRYEVPTIAKAVDGVMSQQLAGLAQKLGGGVSRSVQENADESREAAPVEEMPSAADSADSAGVSDEQAAKPVAPARDADDVAEQLDAIGAGRGDRFS